MDHVQTIAVAILTTILAVVGWLVTRHIAITRQTATTEAAQRQWNENTEKTRALLIDEFRREQDTMRSNMDELNKKLAAQLVRCQEHSTSFGRIMEAISGLQRSFEELQKDFKELHREQHKHGGE